MGVNTGVGEKGGKKTKHVKKDTHVTYPDFVSFSRVWDTLLPITCSLFPAYAVLPACQPVSRPVTCDFNK